jgi:hypothetical protein
MQIWGLAKWTLGETKCIVLECDLGYGTVQMVTNISKKINTSFFGGISVPKIGVTYLDNGNSSLFLNMVITRLLSVVTQKTTYKYLQS